MRFELVIAVAEKSTVPVDVLWAGAAAVVVSALVTVGGSIWQTRKTLRHQRAIGEREELRNVIDEAAAHIDSLTFDSISAISDLERATLEGSGEFTNITEASSDHPAVKLYDERVRELFAEHRKAEGLRARLALRLGKEHPAVQEYKAAIEDLQVMQTRVINGEFLPREQQGKEFAEVGRHMNAFQQLCYGLIGTQLKG